MPEDWVVRDRSSNFLWYAQQHSLARQGPAGTALQNGVLCNGNGTDSGSLQSWQFLALGEAEGKSQAAPT